MMTPNHDLGATGAGRVPKSGEQPVSGPYNGPVGMHEGRTAPHTGPSSTHVRAGMGKIVLLADVLSIDMRVNLRRRNI